MKRSVDDLEVALWYVNQVKRTLGAGEKYRSFYTFLFEFRDGTLSAPDLFSSVKELLSGHDDLLQGFTLFLPKEYAITDPKEYNTTVNGDDKGYHPKRQKFSDDVPKEYTTTVKVDDKGYHPKRQKFSDHVPKEYTATVKVDDKGYHPKRRKFSDELVSQIQQATDFANKVRERFKDGDGVYKSFLDALCGYKKEEKTTSEVQKEMKLLFKDHPDLLIELSRYTADFYAADATEYEKSLWESMKKGKRDESYQKRWKKEHPYETMLFKCEDDHCEVDVAFHRFQSTKEKMELFLQDAEETGGPITDLKEYFTPINLRCIEQLYHLGNEEQGYGPYMIDQLCQNPIKSGYIVLNRLNQKLEEMKNYLSEAKTVWAKVYKDCHEKLQRERQHSRKELEPNFTVDG